MSFIGDLAFDDQRALEQDALANPATTPAQPSFWDGSGTALFTGIGQGLAQLTLQAAQYGNDPTQAILMDVPTDEEEMARRANVGEQRRQLTERLRPSAETSGTAAQVLFGLGDVGARFAFGGASGGLPVAALTAGSSVGEQRFSELRAEGVDTKTAAMAGAVEGGVTAIGAFLPAARLLTAPAADLAAVTAANVGLGVAARGGVGQLLERNGYTQQAQQYKALDVTAMAIDGLLGSLFWGAGRAMGHGPTASPETVDAALAGNNGLHAQHGVAPGAPVDPLSSAAHQGALDMAIEQMSRGEPVNVGGIVDGSTFIRSDHIGPEESAIRQQAEQEVFSRARSELEPIAAAGLPNVRDLRVELNGIQRSLDDLQRTRDSIGDTYRDTAKAFQRQGLSRKQAERAARDSITQRRQDLDAQRAEVEDRAADIRQMLDGNRAAERARADLAAMDRGETPARLEQQVQQRAQEIGSSFKRSAIASSVAPDHGLTLNRLAGQEIQRLLRESGQVVDEASTLQTPAADSVAARVEPSATPIPRQVEQTAAKESPTAEADQTKPEFVRPIEPAPTGEPDPLAGIDPELPGLVDSIVSGERDIQVPTGAFDAEGNAVTISARELLAEADDDIAKAKSDSPGFLAAALCALRFGN